MEMPTVPIQAHLEYPSWDILMADLARIIREDELYPEEMPLECFEIY